MAAPLLPPGGGSRQPPVLQGGRSEAKEATMLFFIDTADISEIRKAHAMGVLDGVTTNPSLVAKTGKRFTEVLKEICAIVDGPISAEVTAVEEKAILDEAHELAKIHENIVVKVPLIVEGLKAVKKLSS